MYIDGIGWLVTGKYLRTADLTRCRAKVQIRSRFARFDSVLVVSVRKASRYVKGSKSELLPEIFGRILRNMRRVMLWNVIRSGIGSRWLCIMAYQPD